MFYSEIRPKIKSGDLLIWEITKISSLIDFILYLYQKIFKTKYSHVGIAIVYRDRVFCLEATPPVVRLIPLSSLNDFYLLQTGIKWHPQYDKVSLVHIGKPYSILDFIKGLFKLKNTDDSLYCSELIAGIYKQIGFIHDDDIGSTPKELVDYLEAKLEISPILIHIDKGNLNAL